MAIAPSPAPRSERQSASSQAGAFPAGFLWGTATSSHQVEGDNRLNDWWAEEQLGRLPASGLACDHYSRFESDFDLARRLGHTAHRFSIEWSRVEPSPGQWDEPSIRHYRQVVEALRTRGIEPIVTLHHFTNPGWFARSGGWLRRDAPLLFDRYVQTIGSALGSEVRYWVTVNEPTVYVPQAYLNGTWPPFGRNQWRSAVRAFRNLARAHRIAYRSLHHLLPDCLVGFAHNAPVVEPCRSDSIPDRTAAGIRDFLLNGLFFQLIGNSRRIDFVGLNYYTRLVVRAAGGPLTRVVGQTCHVTHHRDQGFLSSLGWEVYPAGLRRVLARFARFELPLLITENGIATENESLRQEFIRAHTDILTEALNRSIPLIGYLYWSLMDNFEWDRGFTAPFGLAAVEAGSLSRVVRPSAEYLRRVFDPGPGSDNRVHTPKEQQHEV